MALPTETKRTPQQAWEWVLSSLQMDMSRASFDTWVKSAEVVSFEGGVFTIGCHNDYARQWLESRLTSTFQRMLSGVLNQFVKVEIILLDEVTQAVDQPSDSDVESGVAPEEEKTFLEPVYASLRDALIEPDRVVKMPAYFLRWLPYVGSRTVFEVVGLWQEYYMTSKGKQPKGGEKVSARVERICNWSGVSRAQLFRDLQPGGALSWFAQKVETDHELDRKTGRSKKSSNKYALYGIPLTPGDASDLADFLVTHGIKQNPKKALQEAVEAQPNQILQYPFRAPPNTFAQSIPRRITVQEVIRDAVGRRLDEELSDLADRLADRLLSSSDFILIRWYFLQNWLPKLGHNAAMFLILLRNMCYFNDETGEIREEVWIEGGYPAIAARLGMDNPRLVAHWLPSVLERGNHKAEHSKKTGDEVARREQLQELFSLFVERLDFRQSGRNVFDWHFKVQRNDPLIPEHEVIKRTAVRLLAAADQEGVLVDLYNFLDWLPNDCLETLKNDPMIVLRLSKISNDCFETLEILFNDCFETVKDLPNDCFETLLKSLKSFKDSQKEKEPSTNQDSSGFRSELTDSVGEGASQPGNWDLEKLLCRVSEKNRELLIAQEKSSKPFVSWILYGATNSNIQNPLSLAISKLKEHPNQGAGGAFERLAALSPDTFANYLQLDLAMRDPSDRDWRTTFQTVSHDRLRLLADLLDIQIEQEREW